MAIAVVNASPHAHRRRTQPCLREAKRKRQQQTRSAALQAGNITRKPAVQNHARTRPGRAPYAASGECGSRHARGASGGSCCRNIAAPGKQTKPQRPTTRARKRTMSRRVQQNGARRTFSRKTSYVAAARKHKARTAPYARSAAAAQTETTQTNGARRRRYR